MRNKRILVIVLVVIALPVIITGALHFQGKQKLKTEVKTIVLKIEEYKNLHGFYPEKLNDMGVEETEEGPLFYQKKDSTEYIIYYGTSLGESKVYYSKSESWEKGFVK